MSYTILNLLQKPNVYLPSPGGQGAFEMTFAAQRGHQKASAGANNISHLKLIKYSIEIENATADKDRNRFSMTQFR
jgi:hypothetical protein